MLCVAYNADDIVNFVRLIIGEEACIIILNHLGDGLAIAAMKAVASCDKPRVAASRALNLGSP
jgi:hypothetical protein